MGVAGRRAILHMSAYRVSQLLRTTHRKRSPNQVPGPPDNKREVDSAELVQATAISNYKNTTKNSAELFVSATILVKSSFF